MVDYWLALSAEKVVPGGLLYSIAQSRYLSDFVYSPTAAFHSLTHFLVPGCDSCVEVLTPTRPILPNELVLEPE